MLCANLLTSKLSMVDFRYGTGCRADDRQGNGVSLTLMEMGPATATWRAFLRRSGRAGNQTFTNRLVSRQAPKAAACRARARGVKAKTSQAADIAAMSPLQIGLPGWTRSSPADSNGIRPGVLR